MKPIAIIPARGGSKRIPRKNIRLLAGKPAIAYPIELALKSALFERVIVTTEDPEIASVAAEYGAEVPFKRSDELSDDNASTIDVVADAITRLNLSKVDYICSIYPITPLLSTERLVQAFELIRNNSWNYVFPACEYTTPIEKAFRKDKIERLYPLTPEFMNFRTQDITKSYFDAGQFYFGKTFAWQARLPIMAGNSTFIELRRHEVFDIDEEGDWEYLSKIMELAKGQLNR